MNRRAFLAVLGVAALVRKLPTLTSRHPTLWGDGVHDDTAALQALIDGKPVDYRGTVLTVRDGGYHRLPEPGRFLVSDTLHFRPSGKRWTIDMKGSEIFSERPLNPCLQYHGVSDWSNHKFEAA